MIGTVVGNYRIVELIGEGGMGSVYRGIDQMLEREVALKALRPELARRADLLERFRTEAVVLARLNHPNIATLYNFFRHGDDFYMAMEFVRGETFEGLIRRSGALAPEFSIPIFCQALEGIDHAHEMSIVHRDIKPANIMLTQTSRAKVMDFGIARMLGSARMTRQGSIVGTIEYMSPEQIQGSEGDSRSDIYALGIVLYEMLTGHVPFASTSEYNLMRQQIESAPPFPRSFVPAIPPHVEAAILRALAKSPAQRFQRVMEFHNALQTGAGQAVRAAGYGAVNPNPPQGVEGFPSQPLPPPTAVAGQGWNAPPMYPPQFPPQQPQPVWNNQMPGQQPAGQYWHDPQRAPQYQVQVRSRGWTWKHTVGLIIGIFLLIALPIAVWVAVKAGQNNVGQQTQQTQASQIDFIQQGDQYAAARKWREAESAYRQAGEFQPVDTVTRFKIATAEARQNRHLQSNSDERVITQAEAWPQVESYYRGEVSKNPNNADAHDYLGYALALQKRYKEAEKEVRAAVALDPNFAPYHVSLGSTLRSQKRDGEAESEFRRGIQLDSNNPTGHVGLGSSLVSQGNTSGGESEYRAALQIEPDYTAAHIGLGYAYFRESNYDQAEAEYRRAMTIDPNDDVPHGYEAFVLLAQRKYPEAEAEFRAAIRLNDKDADWHAWLSQALFNEEKYDEAQTEAERAIRLDSSISEAYLNLGNVFFKQQKFAEAEAEYRKGIRLNSNDSVFHYALGLTLEQEQKYDAAAAELEEATRLDPNDAAIQAAVQRVNQERLNQSQSGETFTPNNN